MEYKCKWTWSRSKNYLIESNKRKNDKYIFEFYKNFLNKLEIDSEEFKIENDKNKIVLKYRYKKKYRNELIYQRI
ncbi:hypothetical protein [Candidatus Nanopusillus massiliensis]|uniref:hypothetical protein n=1 Tax=Candidatus Nanopusillus massiliensis TaxID=2897163 RepID=UPI001E358814|nr:hypothetical protein [Candidatus Nanopusillus massiliensis]